MEDEVELELEEDEVELELEVLGSGGAGARSSRDAPAAGDAAKRGDGQSARPSAPSAGGGARAQHGAGGRGEGAPPPCRRLASGDSNLLTVPDSVRTVSGQCPGGCPSYLQPPAARRPRRPQAETARSLGTKRADAGWGGRFMPRGPRGKEWRVRWGCSARHDGQNRAIRAKPSQPHIFRSGEGKTEDFTRDA